MDPLTGLPRVLWLLLFLQLSLLGGHPHPLGGPGPSLDLSQDGSSDEQEPLDRLPEPWNGWLAVEPLRQGHGSAEAWTAKQAASAGGLGPPDYVLQALWGLPSPKKTPASGCFGRKLDRISSSSGLGCKGWRSH
ncbi:natriuretic peptides B [Pteronotus mesoamericanus]|uniref:natriuretic peptides B n=1 Tax=Pteronotus mesoamericanus TaxID=1884717 RepID=UPI0023ECFBDA|nr:natriuretic peptides B [Pteronotus parnellii mesoamericanus]